MSERLRRSAVPRDDGDPHDIDVSVAHSARVYDCWLGGKDNFAADRRAAEQAIAAYPGIVEGVRAARVPRQRRALPGGTGRHPAASRHRHRYPGREQHARGGPIGGARVPRRLRGQ